MSNIGFMKSCTECIKALFDRYMSEGGVKKYPTQAEKQEYLFLLEQFEIMFKNNEIEDKSEYKRLYKILKSCDLTRVTELRKKLRKNLK